MIEHEQYIKYFISSPHTTERNEALRDMTLKQFFYEQYYPRHVQVYTKPKTQVKEDTMCRNNLTPFHNRKMMSITRTEVERLHVELKEHISLYTANRAIGMLKHMYNNRVGLSSA